MSFLGLEGKTILVVGFANKKSVAAHTAAVLKREGARVIHSVRSEARREALLKLEPEAEVELCDVERAGAIESLAESVARRAPKLDGLVHSIAFAKYSNAGANGTEGLPAFFDTERDDFLQAVQVSCHSLIALSRALKPQFSADASVVTISISTTTMAAENYGYMAPVKAALESSVVFLAKSFSAFSKVRFNAVCPGLLKTSASAGIPGYVDSYLYAERATLRKEAVQTREVADTVAFLLSGRSSGINAQRIVIDAGMGSNYFDQALVRAGNKPGSGHAL